MVNEIHVKVSFANFTLTKRNTIAVEGDYNTTKLIFEFEEDVTNRQIKFGMTSPKGELVMFTDLINNEIILAAEDKNGNLCSVFTEAGIYTFNVFLMKENGESQITSAPGYLFVAETQVSKSLKSCMPFLVKLSDIVDNALKHLPNILDFKLDTSMSSTSTKPVQNQVIKKYVDEKSGNLQRQIDLLNRGGLLLKDEYIGSKIHLWLDEHPEATTTVQDKSLTIDKMVIGALDFITPEMFGAKGDGETDDREKIQNALDFASANGKKIVFKKAAKYLVYPTGHSTERDGNHCLIIPSNSYVDLNDATIQCGTNDFVGYNIVYIPVDSKNVTIINGAILGDRDTHITPDKNAVNLAGKLVGSDCSSEWNYAIQTLGSNATLKGLKIGKVRGDGISITSNRQDNHTNSITSWLDKDVDATGVLIDSTTTKTCDFYSLEKELTQGGYFSDYNTFVPRPCIDTKTYPELIANFDRKIKVHFYGGKNDSTWIETREINIGEDVGEIPSAANYIRITFYNPSSEYKASGMHWWVSPITWSRFQRIEQCEIFECGRNGICPHGAKKLVIDQCYIHHIGGTNNNVGIDFEGHKYVNGDAVISNTLIEYGDYTYKIRKHGGGITFSDGWHFIIDNCTLDGGLSGKAHDITVKNCVINGNIVFEQGEYSKDIYAQKMIKNSVVYGCMKSMTDILVNECKIYGDTKNMPNATFTNCELYHDYYDEANFAYMSGIYIGCKIFVPDRLLYLPSAENHSVELINCNVECLGLGKNTVAGKTENNVFIFENCNIAFTGVGFNYTFSEPLVSKVENCEIISKTDGRYVASIRIRNNFNTVISNNKFVFRGVNNQHLGLVGGDENSNVFVENNIFIHAKNIAQPPRTRYGIDISSTVKAKSIIFANNKIIFNDTSASLQDILQGSTTAPVYRNGNLLVGGNSQARAVTEGEKKIIDYPEQYASTEYVDTQIGNIQGDIDAVAEIVGGESDGNNNQ